ncbi:hypothetical protein I4U23_012307 [Adineta vaga]|nr:hypothetical protein I4U23_012307 [Adineta vaga]
MTSFERMPNEIFLECFDYLNAYEIYQSFANLNSRFDELIHTVRLCLDFHHTPKSTFSNKRSTYSLKLSNDIICGQIDVFLLFFSLNQFSHLRLLSLSGLKDDHLKILKSTFPSMPQLSTVYLESVNDRQLIKNRMNELFSPIKFNLPITNLTFQYQNCTQLIQILHDLPMLNYLHVKHISSSYDLDQFSPIELCNAVHLQKLIIYNFPYSFEEIKMLLKCTPNLINLTVSVRANCDMFDACQWEDLITSSLHSLNIFKFNFTTMYLDENMDSKLKQFQTDFWLKKHQWITDYVLRDDQAIIYTLPWHLSSCILKPYKEKYFDQSKRKYRRFDDVRCLKIDFDILSEETECYVPFASSLVLSTNAGLNNNDGLEFYEKQFVERLKMIVNLSNVKSLNIPKIHQLNLSLFLTEILKETPRLSSLTLAPNDLLMLCTDENVQLCRSLNEKITKLQLYCDSSNSFKSSDEMNRFCDRFSNISQMTCSFSKIEHLLYLLEHLPQISVMSGFFLHQFDRHALYSQFEKLTSKWNLIFDVDHVKTCLRLRVWIGRK